MSSYKRGDVVMVHFPFAENPRISKPRPAIILEDEDDPKFILIQCTSTNRSDKLLGIWVISSSKEGKIMGLPLDTFINLDHIIELPKWSIIRKIGDCPFMELIDEKLAG